MEQSVLEADAQYDILPGLITPDPSLPAVPQVSFDTRLGKRLKHIDFDTAAYTDYLADRGLENERIRSLRLRFGPSNAAAALIGGRANYCRYEQAIEVYVGRFTRAKTLNNGVYHETEHHVAYATGTYSPAYFTVLTNLGRVVGLGAAITGDTVSGVGMALDTPEVAHIGYETGFVGLGILCLAQLAYRLNPEERRAFRAGRRFTQPFVQLER